MKLNQQMNHITLGYRIHLALRATTYFTEVPTIVTELILKISQGDGLILK